MSEFIEKQFFFVDRDSVEKAESKLYGYCIYDKSCTDNIYTNPDFSKDNPNGSYVLIQNLQDKVYISQDFIGSYGIFMFEKDEYYALSNSFQFLVDHIKNRFELTLNEDYARHLMFSDLCSHAYEETLIKEIKLLPRALMIIIDKKTKELNFETLDYMENSVDIDSPEGMKLLDGWFLRWTSFIRELYQKNKTIRVDLSGGMDSRLTFALLLKSGIDLNNIRVNSIKDELHTHKEDYEIASSIARAFNFPLNKYQETHNRKLSLEDTINISFYTKLAFHKQMYFKKYCNLEPVFSFSGGGGETLRSHWNYTPEDFITKFCSRQSRYSCDMKTSTEKILRNSFCKLKEKYHYYKDDAFLVRLMYKNTRQRYHFGMDMVENYCSNTVRLLPLLDSDIQKLTHKSSDDNLLLCVILTRYCKELFSFKFDGGRTVLEETKKESEEISNRYKFAAQENSSFDLVYEDISKFYDYDDGETKTPENFCENVFEKKYTRNLFSSIFEDELYEKASNYRQKTKFFPLSEVYPILASVMAIESTLVWNIQGEGGFSRFAKIAKSYRNVVCYPNEITECLNILNTIRVDVINRNKFLENSDIQLSFDNTCLNHDTPKWFVQQGTGHVIECTGNSLKLTLVPDNDGELEITLRSRDIRVLDNKRFLYFVDITSFTVNDVPILDQVLALEPLPVSHDKSCSHRLTVSKCASYIIEIHWKQHYYEKEELKNVLSTLLTREIALRLMKNSIFS